MRVLVTGGRGMLGQALGRVLGEQAALVGRRRCDVRDIRAVSEAFGHVRPDVVIHAAAFTDVDACEEDEMRARDVNIAGTRNVAEAAASRNTRLILISTDYVFPGTLNKPLTEEDLTGPKTVYGRSKLAAEGAAIVHHRDALIIRTSSTYGPGGRHFPLAIARRVAKGEPLRVVDDQHVSPTYVDDLAQAIARALSQPDLNGVFHCANEGAVTWHRFAQEILNLLGKPDHPLEAINSRQLARAAPRPAYSALDSTRIQTELGIVLRDWQSAFRAYFDACGKTIA